MWPWNSILSSEMWVDVNNCKFYKNCPEGNYLEQNFSFHSSCESKFSGKFLTDHINSKVPDLMFLQLGWISFLNDLMEYRCSDVCYGRNRLLFYIFCCISKSLSSLTLWAFFLLLNKQEHHLACFWSPIVVSPATNNSYS